MKKGTVIKHPSADWGKGIVLENAINNTIKVRFERVGLKTLSLEYVKPIILENESLVTIENLQSEIVEHEIWASKNVESKDICDDLENMRKINTVTTAI